MSPASTFDRATSLAVAFGFSVSLGVATVAIPLLALEAGYDAPAIGFLVATSAVAQLGTRLGLPWLLGRWPDRTLIAVASTIMLAGFGLLLASTALPVFVGAQLCQGTARAIFWTASQTHAIRGGGRPIQRLIDLNVSGNAGTLVGPALAGSLAVIGLSVSLAAAALGAALAALGSILLQRFPPYDRRLSAGTTGLLRRDGVDVACWANVIGGGWWSMVGSYIPVILVGAGLGPIAIGWLITASEGAGMVALVALRSIRGASIRRALRLAAAIVVAALIGIALAPASLAVYAVLLLAGGAAGGAVTTLAPALVSLAAGEQEQGDALALSGTFRAAALLGAPASVGLLLSALSLPGAMIVLAASLGGSGLIVGRKGRRSISGG
ncbi:MAG TPA: MFS transporter [Candidatus Eisenbacteria bacterium]|nr:MFS transporter [Candidatus Eisenbacteria bacterium]